MPTSYGAQVPHSRGLQSAYINRRKAPDHSLPTKAAQLPRGLQSTFKNKRKALDLSLPTITQGFNPGIWGGPPGPPGGPPGSGPPGPPGSGPPGPPEVGHQDHQGHHTTGPTTPAATPPLLSVTISQHLLKVTVAIGTLGTQHKAYLIAVVHP